MFGLGKGSTVLKVILVACMLFVALSGFEAVFFETTYGLDIIRTVISAVFQPILSIFGIEIPWLSPATRELSPARKMEGTWKTPFAVKFYFKDDFDTGEYRDVGSQDRMITWIITATSDENIVNIEMRFNSSNTQITSSGWAPDVSPMYYKGLISSSHLTLVGYNVDSGEHDDIKGEFDFTAYFIEGTWDDYWEHLGFKFGVYTATNALKLTKQ